MTGARADILDRIRKAARKASTAPVSREYRQRGAHQAGAPELLTLFADRITEYQAQLRSTTRASLPAVLADLLEPGTERILVPPGLPAEWTALDTVDDDLPPAVLDTYTTVLTGCAAACAETGTIVLDGGAGQGRRASTLIPDRHVCVVQADQVVQTVPELLARLDPRRPLTFISGPSATSDIELRRVEGVHGPRTLVVVLAA